MDRGGREGRQCWEGAWGVRGIAEGRERECTHARGGRGVVTRRLISATCRRVAAIILSYHRRYTHTRESRRKALVHTSIRSPSVSLRLRAPYACTIVAMPRALMMGKRLLALAKSEFTAEEYRNFALRCMSGFALLLFGGSLVMRFREVKTCAAENTFMEPRERCFTSRIQLQSISRDFASRIPRKISLRCTCGGPRPLF